MDVDVPLPAGFGVLNHEARDKPLLRTPNAPHRDAALP